MTNSGLSGPWPLTTDKIDEIVREIRSGNYLLGRQGDKFYYRYTGRADVSLNLRLKQWVGKYPDFKADYASSPKAAYEKECWIYHNLEPADNKVHPDKGDNTDWKCPICGK